MMKRTLLALAITLTVAAPAMADLALATSKNCMACHATDKKLVGPSYKDVAAKYAGQKDAVDQLAVKIIKGSSGVWGPVLLQPKGFVFHPHKPHTKWGGSYGKCVYMQSIRSQHRPLRPRRSVHPSMVFVRNWCSNCPT